MFNFGETMDLLNRYLEFQMLPMSCADVFVQYIVPILQLLVIFGGAFAGLYKYFKTKNREIYQQLLGEVYAPLYQYFVKQELYRKLLNMGGDYHDAPVLEVTLKTDTGSVGGSTSTSSTPVLGLSRKELMKVLDSINIGLAPKELYTLLSMYTVLVHMEETGNKKSDPYLTATIMKVNVENKLRREIISGYKRYHDRLGIKGGAHNDFFTLSEDQLLFTITVPQEEKDALLKDMTLHPEKF